MIWTSDIDVFSSHQQSNVKNVWNSIKHVIEILLISVALNVF